MLKKAKIYIGTSGWVYDDWGNGVFYPVDIKTKNKLEFYSHTFNTVEINSSFYRQVPSTVFSGWRNSVPGDFVFSVKMNRFLTHIKKLKDPDDAWNNFIKSAKELKQKLGPILLQLPPNLKVNTERIAYLLKIIPKNYKVALETRDDSWLCENIYDILRKNNCSLVFADTADCPIEKQWETITADFIYIRMHGNPDTYNSKYSTKKLEMLAYKIKEWKTRVKEIFVYFNNDTKGHATINAKQLINIINNREK